MEFLILKSILPLYFAFTFTFTFTFAFCILHFAFCIYICILHFEFKFPAKNSEFFRFKCLNFPPKDLDVIVVVGGGVVVVVGGHGDNRGTSFNWHFSVKSTAEYWKMTFKC